MAALRRSARTFSRLAGWLVSALALGFLGRELWRNDPWTLAGAHAPELALAIAAGSVGYGLAGLLLAEAWRRLLGPGPAAAHPRHHRALYGRTQIAKYLPGNIFHFVGRQILGRSLGHPHGALALASLAETLSLLAVAGVLATPLVWPRLGRALGSPPDGLLMAVAAILIALIWLNRRRIREGRIGAWAPRVLQAGLLHAAFFSVAGLILLAVAAAIQGSGQGSDTGTLAPTTAVAALAAAWLAGFVVPGAAAGVGVREAVLVLTLEQQLGRDGAMLLALALRLITTLGDLLLFALCSARRPDAPPPRAHAAGTGG